MPNDPGVPDVRLAAGKLSLTDDKRTSWHVPAGSAGSETYSSVYNIEDVRKI